MKVSNPGITQIFVGLHYTNILHDNGPYFRVNDTTYQTVTRLQVLISGYYYLRVNHRAQTNAAVTSTVQLSVNGVSRWEDSMLGIHSIAKVDYVFLTEGDVLWFEQKSSHGAENVEIDKLNIRGIITRKVVPTPFVEIY